MIESTDFTHSSCKVWKQSSNLRKTTLHPNNNIESLKTSCRTNYHSMVKKTRTTSHKEKKTPKQHATESMLTSPFQMEDLPNGINTFKSNKTACLDDMFCEQIKNFGSATLRWVLQMMNSILKSHEFSKLWRKSKVIVILKSGRLCNT